MLCFPVGRHPLARALDRLREPRPVNGLEQIIDGVDFERFNRVLVEGGHEHDSRLHPAREQLPRYLEPGQPGHLHVEQHEIGSQLLDQPDGIDAVAGLPDDVDPTHLVEQEAELAAGRILIVGE